MKWIGAVLLTLALGLSGCGGDDSTPDEEPSGTATTATSTPTPTSTGTESSTPSASGSTAPTPSPSFLPKPKETDMPTIPAEEAPAAAAPIDLTGETLPQFVSASMDITCLFDDHQGVRVRCDVLGAEWQVQRPAGCREAYGDSVTLSTAAKLTCHGDTIFSPDVTVALEPGRSVKFHDFTCTAGQGEVTCRNGDDGGFTVSKAGYSVT